MPLMTSRSLEVVRPTSFILILVSVFIFLPLLVRAADPAMSSKPDVSTNTTLDARVAALASLPLDELRAKAKEVEANIPKLAEQSQTLQKELRDLRIAGQQNEAVLAIRREIAALQKKIDLAIDEIPEVKAKSEEAGTAKAGLFEEMQFRIRLIGLIAAAEKRDVDAQGGQTGAQDAREE